MKVEVFTLNQLDESHFIDFLKRASLEINYPAHKNMWSKSWEQEPATLPYLLYRKKRFSNPKGEFHVLKVDDQIQAVAGVYLSDFDENVAIGSVRAWVSNEYRGKFLIGKHILPEQLAWAKQKNCKLFFLTFNEYNKNLIKIVKRNGLGRAKNRTPDMLFYNGIKEAPFPCNIQYTKQWVVYDVIDENYIFNWDSIRWIGE